MPPDKTSNRRLDLVQKASHIHVTLISMATQAFTERSSAKLRCFEMCMDNLASISIRERERESSYFGSPNLF